MRVLVTGGSGLVGTALQDVTKNNHEWIFASSADADLTDRTETEMLFDRTQPTHVLHLAAKVGGLFANRRANFQFYRINQLINTHVLETAFKCTTVVKCVSIMSTCIFPTGLKIPMSEQDLHRGLPHDSNFGYAMAKRNLDVLSILLNNSGSTLFTTVVPTNLYGPKDNFDPQSSHVIPGLIEKMYQAKTARHPELVLPGTGSAKRQFMLSLDFARALETILVGYEEPTPILISPTNEVTIKDLASLVAQKMGYKGIITFAGDPKDDGMLEKTVSIRKFKSLFPNFQFTSLPLGLAITIQWYLKNKFS